MTPDRHRQIKRLFLAAVELTPAQAESFLNEACGDDPTLRDEVQSLLAHHTVETLLPESPSAEGRTVSDALPTSVLADQWQSAGAAVAVFPPGTIIAGRYRLVAPLGRGGMGVVYRAEDLELSQTIALKFLHAQLKGLGDPLEMLRNEVRVARQIAHPNVVRVFDLGVAEGEVFISMEFVTGETLESLIRRVGRLTADKLLQVARQLAAGLAAAHDNGVLHRDLKPANVMLDENGNVRILDFGIAVTLDAPQKQRLAGTPGFIAPEVLKGQPRSRQSDLFTWGLVIYYAAQGKLPPPSSEQPLDIEPLLMSGVDAKLAHWIRSTLATNPTERPASAHELLVELSAGDPLHEAVAADRVPPQDLLIAARGPRPPRWFFDGLLVSGVALLLFVAMLADRTMFLSRCGLVQSPDILHGTAERMLAKFGDPVEAEALTGVTLDPDCLQFIRSHNELPERWQKVRTGQIPAVFFWYRRGDPHLPRPAPLGEPHWVRIAPATLDTATIRLDGRGKLLSLQIADTPTEKLPRHEPVDWESLFVAAGLQIADFRMVRPAKSPPLFADEVRNWEGPFPADPRLSLTITAAALNGRVVFFDITQPWEQSSSANSTFDGQKSQFVSVRLALWLITIGLSAVLDRHNLRRGHADWTGMKRIVATVMVLGAIRWLLGAQHTFVIAEELAVGYLWLSVIVFTSLLSGLAYLAVEPFARRWWPWSIITSHRLLAGRLGDQNIWRDFLLGIVVGLAAVALRQLGTLLTSTFELPVSGLNDFDFGQDLMEFLGLRYRAAVLINALLHASTAALLLLSILVCLKRFLKSTRAAAVALVVTLTMLEIVGRGIVSPVDWMSRTLLWGICIGLLVRPGLLATIAALATFYAVNNTPVTLNYAAWFAPTSFLILIATAVAMTICWKLARQEPNSSLSNICDGRSQFRRLEN